MQMFNNNSKILIKIIQKNKIKIWKIENNHCISLNKNLI